MPSYTNNIGVLKIDTGDESGTWGDTTNTNHDLIDEAVNGIATIVLAATGSTGAPNDIDITDGALANARNKYIVVTDGGDLGGTVYLRVTPSGAEKVGIFRNNLSGNRSLVIFQGSYNASNDYELLNGRAAWLAFDGGGASATVTNAMENPAATGGILTDTINEETTDAGVTIEGVLVKDNEITAPGNITSSTGTLSGVNLTVTGTVTGPSGTWDSGGMDLATGDTYAINGTNVLSAGELGSTVTVSSLESVGTLADLTVTGAITANGGVIVNGSVSVTGTISGADIDITSNTTDVNITAATDFTVTASSGNHTFDDGTLNQLTLTSSSAILWWPGASTRVLDASDTASSITMNRKDGDDAFFIGAFTTDILQIDTPANPAFRSSSTRHIISYVGSTTDAIYTTSGAARMANTSGQVRLSVAGDNLQFDNIPTSPNTNRPGGLSGDDVWLDVNGFVRMGS